MAVAYYIETEEQIEDLDMSVDGKAIAHADPAKLEIIFRKLRVKPLIEFVSADTEDIADILEDVDDDGFELPDEAWFSAVEGVESVSALLTYLSEHDGELEGQPDVIADLESYQRILTTLAERHVRWHLSIDL